MSDNFFVQEHEQHNPLRQGPDGIQLPFAAPLLYWVNGNADFEELGGVRYHGGWALQHDYWHTIESQCTPLPQYFKLTKFKDHQAYVTRGIAVAPIAIRERWIENRSHLQLLGYMATIDNGGGLLPYGPVVLSAKSNSGKYVKAAFAEFDKVTKSIRPASVPYYRFYVRLGTYGDKPNFVTVGKDKNTHDITPCQAGFPKGGITIEMLREWYVGGDVINECNRLRTEAAMWLNDETWKSGKKYEAQTEQGKDENPF
jgi:hypothetical protein